MRHVSRTHRVDLDWLFERISKDPGIFVKYVPKKEQIADILTKGSFTAEAWNALCKLCVIQPASSYKALSQQSKGIGAVLEIKRGRVFDPQTGLHADNNITLLLRDAMCKAPPPSARRRSRAPPRRRWAAPARAPSRDPRWARIKCKLSVGQPSSASRGPLRCGARWRPISKIPCL